jgi:hypothetical protein
LVGFLKWYEAKPRERVLPYQDKPSQSKEKSLKRDHKDDEATGSGKSCSIGEIKSGVSSSFQIEFI